MLEYEIHGDSVLFTCRHCYNDWSDSNIQLTDEGEPELPVVCPFCTISHYGIVPK